MPTDLRNYQTWLQVVNSPDNATVKVYQVWLQVVTPDFSFGDSLNNWSDAAAHNYPTTVPLGLATGSNFELLDATNLTLFAQIANELASNFELSDDAPALYVVGKLTQASGSGFDEWADDSQTFLFVNLSSSGASDLNSLADSIAIFWPLDLQKYGESSFELSDATLSQLAVQYFQAQEDSLEITDSLDLVKGFRVISGSDLSNWLDAATFIDPFLRSFADSISNWSDVVAFAANWAIKISGQLTLGAQVRLAFLLARVVSSQLSLSDQTQLRKGSLTSFTDEIQLSDATSIGLTVWSPLEVADHMTMTDAMSLYISTAEDDYYRRQINDRVIMNGEKMVFFSDTLTMKDHIQTGVS